MRHTIDDILKDLDAAIERDGVRGYARRVGLSPTFISQVKHRKAPPGPTIIGDLGYSEDGLRFVRNGGCGATLRGTGR